MTLWKINDEYNSSVTIKAGVSGGVSVSNPTFSGNKTASASGATNSGNITLHVDLNKFSELGVYRYKLTDITSDNTLRNNMFAKLNSTIEFASLTKGLQEIPHPL